MGLGQAGKNLKLAGPAGPGLRGSPHTRGLLGFQKAYARAQDRRAVPRSRRAEQGTRGQAEQRCSSQLEPSDPWGALQSCRAWQEGRENPCPSPLLLHPASSFAPGFPFPDLQALAVWQGQLRVPGPAKQRQRGASPTRGQRPGQATFWGPGAGARHPVLTQDTLCQPPFRP